MMIDQSIFPWVIILVLLITFFLFFLDYESIVLGEN